MLELGTYIENMRCFVREIKVNLELFITKGKTSTNTINVSRVKLPNVLKFFGRNGIRVAERKYLLSGKVSGENNPCFESERS